MGSAVLAALVPCPRKATRISRKGQRSTNINYIPNAALSPLEGLLHYDDTQSKPFSIFLIIVVVGGGFLFCFVFLWGGGGALGGGGGSGGGGGGGQQGGKITVAVLEERGETKLNRTEVVKQSFMSSDVG